MKLFIRPTTPALGPLACAAALALLAGCGASPAPAPQAGPAPVEAMTVKVQPLEVRRDLPGRIEAVRSAEVRARIAGIVLSRHFEEGDDVKAGQVLFQIDPAPLKAALARAQGEWARADAALSNAQAVVQRNQPLAAIEAVSRQDFDAAQAALKSAQAAREAAAADRESARLNLEYATVRAPIAGRIGRALVNEGTLVGQAEATPMAVIQQLAPVYVDFKQPVADVLRLRDAQEAGALKGKAGAQAPLWVTVEGTGKQREGRVMFSDVSVDRGTGEVSLRGRLDNADGLLLPGMYVRVQLGQGVDPAAILVPQRAVSRNTGGQAQVMVIGKDDAVEARPVVTGAMVGSQWHIRDGLKAGERIVVSGSAAPGAKVAVTQPKG